MTTDLKVFCVNCRETIIDSGGNAYLKNLIEVIREMKTDIKTDIIFKKADIRKFLNKYNYSDRFEIEILNCYRVERIKRLLKCIKKNHDLEFEYL